MKKKDKRKRPSEKIFDYHDEMMRKYSVREDRLIWIPGYPRLQSVEFLFWAILRYLDELKEVRK